MSLSSLTTWAQTAETDDFWIIASVLVLATVVSFVSVFYYLIRKRIIQDTPTSKVRSAAQGYVELTGIGELIPGDKISAPLTKTICTWFSYKIEEHRRSGKNSKWVTVESKESDALFLLIDDTGQATIDPEDAAITPMETDIWYGNSRFPRNGPGKKVNKFFLFGVGRYRYTEKRMHPGDPLYAIGLFNTVGGAGSELNVNNDVRKLLAEWKQDSQALLEKFDSNKDGQIDMEEWQRARDMALKEVMAKHAQRMAAPIHMMGKTCDKRRPYLLSALPASELIHKFTAYSSIAIVIFFSAGALATLLINARLAN